MWLFSCNRITRLSLLERSTYVFVTYTLGRMGLFIICIIFYYTRYKVKYSICHIVTTLLYSYIINIICITCYLFCTSTLLFKTVKVGIRIIVRSKFWRFFCRLFQSNATRLCNTHKNVFMYNFYRIILYYIMNFWFSQYDIRAFNTYGRQPRKK